MLCNVRATTKRENRIIKSTLTSGEKKKKICCDLWDVINKHSTTLKYAFIPTQCNCISNITSVAAARITVFKKCIKNRPLYNNNLTPVE